MITQDHTGKVESSHIAVDTLAWLIEEAFEGDPDQSLMANLRDLREEDWTTLPPGAGRSIADIIEHVGWSKWMYEDYAFGSASLRGDEPPLIPADGARSRPRDELVAWLKQGHHRWLASVRALANDRELERERLANWGDHLRTKVLVRIMIAHDLYHAGEINHLRALLHGTDRWPYEK
jgi:DinB family protein